MDGQVVNGEPPPKVEARAPGEGRGGPVRLAKAPFAEAVLVCGKCARKLKGRGFGPKGRRSLRQALKRELKAAGRPGKVRLVETSCLGLCPKGAQAAATPEGLLARRLLVVAPGAPAEAVLTRLIGPSPRAACDPVPDPSRA